MEMHAYYVKKQIGNVVFDCCESDEWTQRLLKLGKFDNGRWMEFTADELAAIEAEENLTTYEKEVVSLLKRIIEANRGEPVYLEYC
jgi:hypothetical protein